MKPYEYKPQATGDVDKDHAALSAWNAQDQRWWHEETKNRRNRNWWVINGFMPTAKGLLYTKYIPAEEAII